MSCESPLERPGDALVMALEVENPASEGLQRGGVIRSEGLPLEHGEVDFDLVEPARMDGAVDEDEVGEPSSESSDGGGAAVCGAVVDDPEAPSGVTVERLARSGRYLLAAGFGRGLFLMLCRGLQRWPHGIRQGFQSPA